MSKTVAEIQKELEEAKTAERLAQHQRDLEFYKERKGKCYCTHTLERRSKALYVSFVKVLDVYANENGVYKTAETMSLHYRRGDFMTFNFQGPTAYQIGGYPEFGKHEITEAQYNAARDLAVAKIESITDEMRAGMKLTDWVSGGDYTREKNYVKHLQAAGVALIDINEDPDAYPYEKMVNYLSWYDHPLFFANRYLVRSLESKAILQSIINEKEEHARQWGGSIWERDMPRVQIMKDFLNSTNWDPKA